MYEYRVPSDGLAGFSLTAHANALANPNAMYRRALRPEEYSSAPKISDPVNRMDAAPVADGAAAIVLSRSEHLPGVRDRPRVQILASAVSTTALALHDQPDLLGLAAAADSVLKAYAQVGLSPEAIDLFELHDLFSIYAALSLEAAGFASRGEGWRLATGGAITRQGRIPISTFGGSKARGDAAGATGIYQAAEVALQLQGRAGEAQVARARVGMAQCLGGAGATAVTHILGRLEGS
jgi:acetyl-CoA C-acetyltransferase